MKRVLAILAGYLVCQFACVNVLLAQANFTNALLDPIAKRVPLEKKCFIVFVSEITAAVTTGHLIKVFHTSARADYPETQIIYVMEGNAVNKDNVKRYFKEVFKLDSLGKHDHILIDSAIFKQQPAQFHVLSGLVVVVDRQIRYISPLKMSNYGYALEQSKQYVGLGKKEELPSDPNVFRELLDRYFVVNNKKWVKIANSYDIQLIDSQNGQCVKTYHNKNFNALEIFSQHFAENQDEIAYATEHQKWYVNNNRHDIHCYNIKVDEQSIWLMAGATVMRTANKDTVVAGMTRKAGQPVGYNHLFFAQFDHSLNLKNIYPIDVAHWQSAGIFINTWEFYHDYQKQTMNFLNQLNPQEKLISVFKKDAKGKYFFDHYQDLKFSGLGLDMEQLADDDIFLEWVPLGTDHYGILDPKANKIFDSKTGKLVYQLNKGLHFADAKDVVIQSFYPSPDAKYLVILLSLDKHHFVDLVDLQTYRTVKRAELMLDSKDIYRVGTLFYDGEHVVLFASTYGKIVLRKYPLIIDMTRGF